MGTFKNLNLELADWNLIYEVVSACGNAHHPRAFAIDMVKTLGKIIKFDQSIVYFIDATGKACGQYQRNISEKYSNLYQTYHESIQGKNNLFGEDRENPNAPTIVLFDWSKDDYYSEAEKRELIYPRKLTYSCDFVLYDLNGRYRLVVALDKTSKSNFKEKELVNLSLTVKLLNSMYKNFFFRDDMLGKIQQKDWATWKLTAREIEIVDLIMQGVKTKEIAETLYISYATVNKHIQHIHEKMDISTNREMMALLMGMSE